MKRLRFKAAAVVALLLVFAIESSAVPGLSQAIDRMLLRVIAGRCMSCHDTETREGGIDLTPLLQKRIVSEEKNTKLWIRVERMVSRGEMPPKDEGPLTLEGKGSHSTMVSRVVCFATGKGPYRANVVTTFNAL